MTVLNKGKDMPVLTALAFAISFAERLPALIVSGQDVIRLVKTHLAKQKQFRDEERAPTQEEWNAQDDRINALEDRLNDD